MSATLARPSPAESGPAEPWASLRECPDCGLFQTLPNLRPGQAAFCVRCHATLRRRRRDSFRTVAALLLAGLALFSIVLYAPLLGFQFAGRVEETTLPSLPFAFDRFNLWELSIVVLGVTVFAPLLKLLCTVGVLIGLERRIDPVHLAAMARIRAWLGQWAMIEVFLLGVFVAYTRLSAYAIVLVGPALYALGALMFVVVTADAWLDEHAMWEAIGRRRARREHDGEVLGCDTCGHAGPGHVGELCGTCDSRLRWRKPNPVGRCWALVLAAAALYVPANLLPVMTIVQVGQSYTSTILGGVQELIAYQMWPLALLVFCASIVVPMLKLILLIWMLIGTQRHSAAGLRRRTQMYRVVEVIGRWSMIDVFMVTILTALVRMGSLAAVYPRAGILCFAGVVILTMLAASCFDPRVMWDVAERKAPGPEPTPGPAGARMEMA